MKVYDWTCAVLFAVPMIAMMTAIAFIVVACSPFALLWLLRRAVFADDVGLREWLWDNLMEKMGVFK